MIQVYRDSFISLKKVIKLHQYSFAQMCIYRIPIIPLLSIRCWLCQKCMHAIQKRLSLCAVFSIINPYRKSLWHCQTADMQCERIAICTHTKNKAIFFLSLTFYVYTGSLLSPGPRDISFLIDERKRKRYIVNRGQTWTSSIEEW